MTKLRNFYVSNSVSSLGHLYEPISTTKVRYVHTKAIHPVPNSMCTAEPLIVQWMMNDRDNRELYLKKYPQDYNRFTSNRFSNKYLYNTDLTIQCIEELNGDDFYDLQASVINYCESVVTPSCDILFFECLFDFTFCMNKAVTNSTASTTPTNGDTTMTNANTQPDLYKFIDADGKEVFCTYLATDSTGKSVMEVKGTGVVMSCDKDKLEIVRPFALEIKWLTSCNSTIAYNVEGDTSVFKEGMMLFSTKHNGIGLINKLSSDKAIAGMMHVDDLRLMMMTKFVTSDKKK